MIKISWREKLFWRKSKILDDENIALPILEKLGAVIKDSHVVYASGKHGAVYVNKDALYPHTKETSDLCRIIAKHFAADNVEVVIAPAIGGVILSQWTAHHLSKITGREIFSVYAEKAGMSGKYIIKRDYEKLVPGKNILVLDDIITTGGTVKKIIEAVRVSDGKIIGLGVLWNRGGVTLTDIPNLPELFALVNFKFEAWEEAECPFCAQGIPINMTVGRGREYLARKQERERERNNRIL